MTVGEAFLSAFLQVAFDRLASREFLDLFRDHKLEYVLKKLNATLSIIKAMLNDAEQKQLTSTAVKLWLDDLKDAAYEAEDVLDELSTEVLRSKLEAESQVGTSQVWNNLVSFPIHLSSMLGNGIETQMKEITDRLAGIADQRFDLGLREVVGGSSSKAMSRLPTTSLVSGSCVFGRDCIKESIIKQVLWDEGNDGDVCVIPIIGMGGIGKTTLSQIVYNDERVSDHFDLKVWAYVSENFDVIRITKTILESVTSVPCEFKDLNLLQVRLKESLREKKFSLVVDDMWNENYNDWDLLQSPFRAGSRGSKIIVTTRNEGVSSIMATGPIHRLKQLSNEDCWLLFKHHAFGKRSLDAYPCLELIGKEIVKKCKGLPLAAKTLGGLLRSKRNENEWKDILHSEIWDFPDDKSNVLPALRLSYHYLPAHLKQCFAYCSIFPKDYEFEKEKIVLLWMAQGYLQLPERKKRVEDLGDEYFCDLLSRSFFQQSCTSKSRFVMHDLINDLAQFVSGESCHRLEVDKQLIISAKIRHLSFIRGKYDSLGKFEALPDSKFLRTFLSYDLHRSKVFTLDKKVSHDLLPKLRCLRVLCLSQYLITELPDSIGDLIHLRYLDLSCTDFKRLPESISTLHNLQTLLLCNCCFLTELPADMGNLINLRHLDITGCNLHQMPLQLGKLKSLQTLSTFIVGKDDGLRIRELKELLHLRGTLSITKLQNVIDPFDAKEANLKIKQNLNELVFEWSNNDDSHGRDEAEILAMLKPHTNIRKLTITCFHGSSIPGWVGDPSFSNLVSLRFLKCKNCELLPSFGQLPSLKDLIVEGMDGVKIVGPEFYGVGPVNKPFQCLRTLKFEDMPEWVEWYSFGVNENEEFPTLRELSIQRCPKLVSDLPKLLHSLVKLEVRNCKELTAVPNSYSLRKLVLEECHEVLLKSVANFDSLASLYIGGISKLSILPDGFLQQLIALKELRIVNCVELKTLSNRVGLQKITSLRVLEISECPLLEALPHELQSLTSLQRLIIKGCSRLQSLPSLEMLSRLRYLMIKDCEALESLPEGLMQNVVNDRSNISSLEFLEIDRCSSLLHFPIGKPPATLKRLGIRNCTNLNSLPDSLHNLTSLRNLYITNCPRLGSFPDGGLPTTIMFLQISDCENLCNELKCQLPKLTALKYFSFAGCSSLVSFPEGWLLPHTLTCLSIYRLPNLICLSKELQQLTSLEKLEISMCDKLEFFPDHGLPTSLSFLNIKKCRLLKQKCQKEKEEHWPKIAHIPCIKIDDM